MGNLMKGRLFVLIFLMLAGLLAACAPSVGRTLTVMTHDSFAISENLIAQFESEQNIKVSFVRSGDTARCRA